MKMKSQARKGATKNAGAIEPFIVFFNDGKALAIKARTWSWEPSGDQIVFHKTSDHPSLFRATKIYCIVHVSDLAEVPEWIDMQSQIKQIMKRLETVEQAIL